MNQPVFHQLAFVPVTDLDFARPGATIGLLVAGVLLVLLGVYYVGKNISGRGAVSGEEQGDGPSQRYRIKLPAVLLAIGVVSICVGGLTWRASQNVIEHYSNPDTAIFNAPPTRSGLVGRPHKPSFTEKEKYRIMERREANKEDGEDGLYRGKVLVAGGSIMTVCTLLFIGIRRMRK